jgi:SAM-dependent methyltransferase
MKEFWDTRYKETTYAYGEEPNLFFKEQLDLLPPGKLLLPFEGEGRNAVYAALQGWEVFAFDFSEAGKEKALQLARKHEVSIDYQISTWEAYDFQAESFDMVALIYAHLPSDKRSLFHAQALKALKKGGTLVLEAFNQNQLGKPSGGPQHEDALFSSAALKNDFRTSSIAILKEEESFLSEGIYHVGSAEIVRLVAKK